MSKTRVYVSSTLGGLASMMGSGGVGPPPFLAHAVTERLRAAHAGDDEELEYAALTAAARQSIGMITDEDAPRRLVLAVDVPSVLPVRDGETTLVEVQEVVATTEIAACHLDSGEAEPDVRAAAEVWQQAEAGDEEARRLVDRCQAHELSWFATQEIGDLLDRFG